jgi:energy-coupling factor transporter ATP-binding protein EcfA2
MEFKLLALQLNKENQYTKNLKIGVLYQFTQEFEFIYEQSSKKKEKRGHDDLIEIRNRNTYPTDLYDIKHHKVINHVNITAILGKNGAGKSTLLELLYLLLYCLSERKEFLEDRSNNSKFIERNHLIDYYEQLNKKIDNILGISQMELFYKFDNEFCLISNSGKQINFYVLNNGKWEIKEFERNKFFYTICVNYSLHGLNSSGEYFWLNGLFHKNDGYKTPLVITPWREKGNIDINIELHLAQTRILANIIGESFESQNLIDDKTISGVEFKIVPDNIGKIEFFTLGFIYRNTNKINNIDLVDLFETLVTSYDPAIKPELKEVLKFLKDDLGREIADKEATESTLKEFLFTNISSVDSTIIRRLLAKYILAKIVKICIKYSDFQVFTSFWSFEENKVANILLINNSSKLVQKLKKDRTHVTLKLKQAINAFLYDYLGSNQWTIERNPENLERAVFKTNLKFSDFQLMIKGAFGKSKQKPKSVTGFIPTGFFWPTIHVNNGKGSSPFGQLSSGEQQMVHAIHSILYHVLNLDSLADSKQPYKAVNLVLDEIELYYHPEYQRLFVKKLLESLSKLKLKCISGFNIIFSTHSPFILSDIPHRNVLKLRDGFAEPFNDEAKTFGSNIHEMLTDSFFLDKNLIGAFAESKIQQCLKKLRLLELGREKEILQGSQEVADNGTLISRINEEINKLNGKKQAFIYQDEHGLEIETKTLYKTISIIGEPIVKYKLLEMYDEILSIEDRVKAKAKRDIQEIMERTGIKIEDF